jgi:ribonuclease HI
MPRNPEEAHVRKRVREYLDGAVLTKDGRPLSNKAVAAFVPCSRTTFYKYGQEKEVEKTRRALKGGGKNEQKTGREAELEALLLAAEARADEFEHKYNNLLTKSILVEYHLRGNPAVDLDAIYNTPIPPPDRSSPYQSSSFNSRL